jgi:hypothetical protein
MKSDTSTSRLSYKMTKGKRELSTIGSMQGGKWENVLSVNCDKIIYITIKRKKLPQGFRTSNCNVIREQWKLNVGW